MVTRIRSSSDLYPNLAHSAYCIPIQSWIHLNHSPKQTSENPQNLHYAGPCHLGQGPLSLVASERSVLRALASQNAARTRPNKKENKNTKSPERGGFGGAAAPPTRGPGGKTSKISFRATFLLNHLLKWSYYIVVLNGPELAVTSPNGRPKIRRILLTRLPITISSGR